jgi:Zn-dependent peptidase ImmA (M78 family)
VSRNGDLVVAKTTREIFDAAMRARRELTIGESGRLAVRAEWLLEKRVRPILGVEIDAVPDAEMPEAYAVYLPKNKIMKITESVLRKAELEDPEALFTIYHELGHIYLHSDPVYFRQNKFNRVVKQNSAEWQADRFAVEFMIDRAELSTRYQNDIAAAAVYFQVPLEKLANYVAELRGEGLIASSGSELVQRHIQQRFDF